MHVTFMILSVLSVCILFVCFFFCILVQSLKCYVKYNSSIGPFYSRRLASTAVNTSIGVFSLYKTKFPNAPTVDKNEGVYVCVCRV